MTSARGMLTSGTLTLFVALAAVLLQGCAPPIAIQGKVARYSLTDRITATPVRDLNQGAEGYVAGDVRYVLSGGLSEEDFIEQDPSQILFSLGAATAGGVSGTGELLTLNGTSYIKSVDAGKGYAVEVARYGIRTPFSFGLMKGSGPDSLQHITGRGGVTIAELYEGLSRVYPGTYAIVGVGHFAELSISALKLAPVYGEDILAAGNRDKYFHETKVVRDCEGVFFGVIDDRSPSASGGGLRDRIFYTHFAGVNHTGIRSHSHVAVSMGAPGRFLYHRGGDTFKAVTARTVDDILGAIDRAGFRDIGHMLEQSVITDAMLMLFKLDRIGEYVAPEGGGAGRVSARQQEVDFSACADASSGSPAEDFLPSQASISQNSLAR